MSVFGSIERSEASTGLCPLSLWVTTVQILYRLHALVWGCVIDHVDSSRLLLSGQQRTLMDLFVAEGSLDVIISVKLPMAYSYPPLNYNQPHGAVEQWESKGFETKQKTTSDTAFLTSTSLKLMQHLDTHQPQLWIFWNDEHSLWSPWAQVESEEQWRVTRETKNNQTGILQEKRIKGLRPKWQQAFLRYFLCF